MIAPKSELFLRGYCVESESGFVSFSTIILSLEEKNKKQILNLPVIAHLYFCLQMFSIVMEYKVKIFVFIDQFFTTNR